jgi:hypothetical protein
LKENIEFGEERYANKEKVSAKGYIGSENIILLGGGGDFSGLLDTSML